MMPGDVTQIAYTTIQMIQSAVLDYFETRRSSRLNPDDGFADQSAPPHQLAPRWW